MEWLSTPVAAGVLIVLWSFEAFLPGLRGPRAGVAQRVRHIALGLLNAAIAGGVVLAIIAVERVAAARGVGLFRWVDNPWWLQVAIAILVLDFWQYAWHIMAHKVPVLWRFHAVHHHADHLEATVAMRFHSFEVAAQGLATIPVLTLLGASIQHLLAYNLVLLPVSLFHHSNIRLSPWIDRVLRLFIVTPRMHWVHHSRWQPETDSNYSAVFSFWDRLFGTLRTRRRAENIDIGLDGFTPALTGTLRGMLITPFTGSRSAHGQAPPPADLQPDAPFFPSLRAQRRRGDDSIATHPVVSRSRAPGRQAHSVGWSWAPPIPPVRNGRTAG